MVMWSIMIGVSVILVLFVLGRGEDRNTPVRSRLSGAIAAVLVSSACSTCPSRVAGAGPADLREAVWEHETPDHCARHGFADGVVPRVAMAVELRLERPGLLV